MKRNTLAILFIISILIIIGLLSLVVVRLYSPITHTYFLTEEQQKLLIGSISGGIEYNSGTGEEYTEKCLNACAKRCVSSGYKYDFSFIVSRDNFPECLGSQNCCMCGCIE